MKALGVLTLGLVALTAAQGCKQKEPEPIPGPKAGGPVAAYGYWHTPGIAWFQGSFDEAFAETEIPQHCRGDYRLIAPRSTDLARNRKGSNVPAAPAICNGESCRVLSHPRHRLA